MIRLIWNPTNLFLTDLRVVENLKNLKIKDDKKVCSLEPEQTAEITVVFLVFLKRYKLNAFDCIVVVKRK